MDTPDSPPDLYTHSQSFSDTPATTPSKSMNIATPHEKINHGAPGSSWTSKKFREEYDRIWDGLVHREWDGSEFSSGGCGGKGGEMLI